MMDDDQKERLKAEFRRQVIGNPVVIQDQGFSIRPMPVTAETIVELLNSAFAADPAAIHALCCNRVPCNQALADHPSIQVAGMRQNGEFHFMIGLLGILNGLCQDSGELVALKFDDGIENGGYSAAYSVASVTHGDPGCVGFCVINEPVVQKP